MTKDGAMGAKRKVNEAIVDKVLRRQYLVHDIPKV